MRFASVTSKKLVKIDDFHYYVDDCAGPLFTHVGLHEHGTVPQIPLEM